MESSENRSDSAKLFLDEFHTFFGPHIANLCDCGDILRDELCALDRQRVDCISLMEDIACSLRGMTLKEYLGAYACKMSELRNNARDVNARLDDVAAKATKYLDRCSEWRASYNQVPVFVRLFHFLPWCRAYLDQWSFSTMHPDELGFLRRGMHIYEIECLYHKMVSELDNEKRSYMEQSKKIDGMIRAVEQERKDIESKIDELRVHFLKLNKFEIVPQEVPTDVWEDFDIVCLNEWLDKVRYVEFWLAVHYYECRWLQQDYPLSENQRGKTYENILSKMYHRLAMISPCLVMTFFVLPKQFRAFLPNKNHRYMYDFIDLLIVDEAGQISPEVAAPSFALAKKALVIGDEKQISPVWGIDKPMDCSLAMQNHIIKDKSEYYNFAASGLSCSRSSIMTAATFSSAYGGLFLREHRRCYDEIVNFCNELVYSGRLEPMRGLFNEAVNNEIRGYLAPMGYIQVTTQMSQVQGTSRRNKREAEEIVAWLKKNFPVIVDRYSHGNTKQINKRNLVGVITPFKSQSLLIQSLIALHLPSCASFVDVGTVNSFQGAERCVVIMSTVYGNEEECRFINNNPNLINVAVSRAKDSFIVFGDRGCLSDDVRTPSGLLKKMTEVAIG